MGSRHLAGQPWEGDVGGAQGIVTGPAALLELQGGRAVDVADEAAEHGQGEQHQLFVPCPPVHNISNTSLPLS